MNNVDQGFNNKSKEIIKEFVVKKMILLLGEPGCGQKINEDKEIVKKLGIQLAPQDLKPLVEAIRGAEIIDRENKLIKDGLIMKAYFTVMKDLFHKTDMLAYYEKFSQVKLVQFHFSDFYYVTTALRIFDFADWGKDSLNVDGLVEIKNYYFNTVLNSDLSGEDKIYNLNVLQDDLKIALSEEEKTALSKHLKENIMKLVDLIDQMRRTSFGAKPLPVEAKPYKHRPEPEREPEPEQPSFASEEQPSIALEEPPSSDDQGSEKKKHHRLFGRK